MVQNNNTDSSKIRYIGWDLCKAHNEQDKKQTDENGHFIPNTLDQSHTFSLKSVI